jgi:type IV pilus assembly protein PilO
VQMQLYEPQAAPETTGADGKPTKPGAAAAKPSAAGGSKEGDAAAGGLLEVEGLKRSSVLVSAKGSYPAMLRFLRGLEERNVLVVQSDLQMTLDEAKNAAPNQVQFVPPVVLKVVMSIYGKTDKPGGTLAAPAPRAST